MSESYLSGTVSPFILSVVTKTDNIMASWGSLSPRI